MAAAADPAQLTGVQLRLDAALPLDPADLSNLSIYERTALYVELGLAPCQRQAAEDAVRLQATGKYPTSKSIGGSRDTREATSRPDRKER